MNNRKSKILIVDDTQDVLDILRELLITKGYNVVTANRGDKALEQLNNDHIDLVLLDVKMPEMDGFEVCKKIKSNKNTKHIPVMLQTAVYDDLKHKINGLGSGADDYISKPIRNEELLARVANLIRVKNLYDELNESKNLLSKKVNELEAANEELTLMQRELIHAGKLSAMGQMSAEMAHEINNPLSAIKLLVDQMILHNGNNTLDKNEISKSLGDLTENISKIAEAINHMKMFARKSEEIQDQINLNDVIKSSIEMIKGRFEQKGIKVEENLKKEPLNIVGNKNKLEQLFVNLLLNARDAIIDAKKDQKIVKVYAKLDENNNICVQIADNGIGMDKKTIEQIFDPFFTTKGEHEGVGLGLSIAHKVAEEHKGKISVNSKKDEGTTFTITFDNDKIAK